MRLGDQMATDKRSAYEAMVSHRDSTVGNGGVEP